MHARVARRHVAAVGEAFADLRAAARGQGDPGSQRLPVAVAAHQAKRQPVVSRAVLIVQDEGRALRVNDQQVQAAIIVQVPDTEAPPDDATGEIGTGAR